MFHWACSGNLKTILADFQAFKPTFILAVPRIFEKSTMRPRKGRFGLKGRVFAGATQVARDWSYAQQSGEGIPVGAGMKHALYDKLVYSSIMMCSVDMWNTRFPAARRSTLHRALLQWRGTAFARRIRHDRNLRSSSVNPTVGYKIGTIGLPLQGVTMGVDETGELRIKSPAVCVDTITIRRYRAADRRWVAAHR